MNRLTLVHKKIRGVIAIEAVIGVTIAALILIFTTHAIVQFVSVGRDVSDKTQALYLAEEGLELLRFMHDDDWANIDTLSNNTTHYISVTPAAVEATTTKEVIGRFTRSFYLRDVYRDGNDDIVASTTGGSVADSDSRYVTTVVAWGTPTTTVTLTTILANVTP